MEPPPGRRTRIAVRLLFALSPIALLTACVPDQPIPAAPATSAAVTPEPSTPASMPTQPTPTASATESATPPATGPSSRPSGRPTYPVPTEPACALPSDVPETVPGANGPTLTATQVEKAWKKSEAGRSLGVDAGTLDKRDHSTNTPGRLVRVPGSPWVALRIMEWSSVTTMVLSSPGVAAAKLDAIRALVGKPCSYGLGASAVVARLTRDEPDLVVVTGSMEGTPITDTFVRYGNTVTHAMMMLVPPDADQTRSMVLETLSRA